MTILRDFPWARLGLTALLFAPFGCSKTTQEISTDAGVAASSPPQHGTHVRGANRAKPMGAGAPLNTHKPDFARVSVDIAGTRAAIREYHMVHGGQYPPSLDVLKLSLSFPNDIAYDPKSGTAKSRTYPHL